MMRRIVLLSWLVACDSGGTGEAKPSDPVETKAVEAKSAETKSAETKSVGTKAVETKSAETKSVGTKAVEAPVPAPPPRVLAAYPEPWDPDEPVELETLATKTMFVIADKSAVCPTRSQAEARECGNSEEFSDEGLRLVLGETVIVVGDAPFDGHWRAIRFQVGGILPAWIRADDVAERPRLEALDAFDRREDVAKAIPVDGMTSEEIHALEPGTLVRWTRKRGVERAQWRQFYADDPDDGIVLYMPTQGGKPVGIKLLQDQNGDGPLYSELHRFVGEPDMLRLDYSCEKDGHCDEISVLARTTMHRAGPPIVEPMLGIDPPFPKAWKKYFMPALDGVVVADRFGVWTFDTPTRAAAVPASTP